MAQAGMHALIGAAVRKVAPQREGLMLGVILGSFFPDLDNYFVAVATLAKWDTHGLHRTFTHSLFAILAVVVLFYIIAWLRKAPRCSNLGLGLGVGMGLHVALDLLLWFDGVELLWPFGGWLNFWEGVDPPLWFARLMQPAEFLFLALFFAWLASAARLRQTDADFQGRLRGWLIAMLVFTVVFTPLAYLLNKGFTTLYGAFYLLSLTAAFVIAIRMRQTIGAFA